MGCIICNMLEIEGRKPDYEKCVACVDVDNTDRDEQLVKEIIEEMCNDIAVNHPEMVKRIHEIELDSAQLVCGTKYATGISE